MSQEEFLGFLFAGMGFSAGIDGGLAAAVFVMFFGGASGFVAGLIFRKLGLVVNKND